MNILPKHVGIIMDGNGRWATERGLSRNEGHKAGAENLKGLLKHIFKKGIPYVSIYAFSTENFKRSSVEVEGLMNLFVKLFEREFEYFRQYDIKVIFSGRSNPLPLKVLKSMKEMEEKTKDCNKATLNICLNYGGQYEIVDAVKKICEKVKDNYLSIEDIDRKIIEENLYQVLPPLDFVIRTSGELRISNFMLWQSAYSEYYFPDTYFPDFNEEEFDKSLEIYQNRNRRYGGNKK